MDLVTVVYIHMWQCALALYYCICVYIWFILEHLKTALSRSSGMDIDLKEKDQRQQKQKMFMNLREKKNKYKLSEATYKKWFSMFLFFLLTHSNRLCLSQKQQPTVAVIPKIQKLWLQTYWSYLSLLKDVMGYILNVYKWFKFKVSVSLCYLDLTLRNLTR